MGQCFDRSERRLVEPDRCPDRRDACAGLCHPPHPYRQDEFHAVPLCIPLHVDRNDHPFHSGIEIVSLGKEFNMSNLTSIAIRVADMKAMVAFYAEAFQIQFQEVSTYGILSQFGEL